VDIGNIMKSFLRDFARKPEELITIHKYLPIGPTHTDDPKLKKYI